MRRLTIVLALVAAGACSQFSSSDPADGTDGGSPRDDDAGAARDSGHVALVDAGVDADAAVTVLGDAAIEGGDMVSAFGAFYIDRTEVTNGAYNAFLLAKGASLSGQHPRCMFNKDFARATTCTHTTGDPFPVNCIDWCDAWAYCAWAGKKLCGAISPDGGLDPSNYTSPSHSRWTLACGGASQQTYPYGATPDAGACVVVETTDAGPKPVGSAPGCVGSAPGVHDMSGNVREWEDDCFFNGTDDQNNCQTRGGGFDTTAVGATCVNTDFLARGSATPGVGFRCCADNP